MHASSRDHAAPSRLTVSTLPSSPGADEDDACADVHISNFSVFHPGRLNVMV